MKQNERVQTNNSLDTSFNTSQLGYRINYSLLDFMETKHFVLGPETDK